MRRRAVLQIMLAAAGMAACRAEGGVGARANLYDCEGCEAVAERPRDGMASAARLAGPDEPGERLTLTGVVYATDGETPAADIVIYAHHTNSDGYYANGEQTTEAGRRHGRLRGWVRTGADGRYRFDTIKPAPYPDMTMPAHIHLMIGEPGRRPYYVDDVVFDGEFGVTERYRAAQELRGGSGIVALSRSPQGVWLARRDIVLERHP
jgi:protocatechuate 3,4-dioxygenase beta subunit